MTSGQWRKFEELYHAAHQRDPRERSAFLADACRGDEDLKRNLESLLAQDSADNILDGPAAQFIPDTPPPPPESNARSLSPGDKLGPYEIAGLIGSGGMGEVYRARDSRLGRIVALKVLPASKVSDLARKRRFVQEARAVSALNHPNIVVIHDIAEESGIDFLVMEFVEGKTLHEAIPRQGLRLSDSLKYAIQIADALACAHAAGIVHRDLKPSNIMLTTQGRVKVLDFGIAKLTEEVAPGLEKSTLTDPGMLMGSAEYMSPEQAEGQVVDARSDIFSFGTVLYQMLTGRSAFHGGSPMSTLGSIIHKEPQLIRELNGTVPADLEKITFRCMRKDPQRRFQYIAEVRAALLDLLEGAEAVPLPASGGHRPDLRPWLVSISAVVLAAAAVWYLRQAPLPPPPDPIPLTTDAGREFDATFSPDGNSVAYSWNGDAKNNYDIYVRVIGTNSALRVTTDPDEDVNPAWSPDGRTIAFVRRSPGAASSVVLVPPLGGHERRVARIGGLGSLCWSPDSKWLFVEDRSDAQSPELLYALSVETGERITLTNPPAESRGDRDPAISPDGRTLAFVRTLASGQGDLYVAPLQGFTALGKPMRVTRTGQITSRPVWLSSGKELVVVGGVMGNSVLARVAAKEGAGPVRMGYAGELTEAPALSPDGHRLAYTRQIKDSNIWRVRLPEQPGRIARPEQFISSTRQDFNPRYSPDGKRVAFSSNRSGSFEIWVADSEGMGAIPVTSFGGARVGSPRWSPDSERIIFDCNALGEPRIYMVSASGGQPRLIENTGDAAVPSWSYDGKWIYFGSKRTGRNEVWRIPADGGTPVQVTRYGGYTAYETPDGKSLCYTRNDGPTELKMISLADPKDETALIDLEAQRAFEVAHDGFWYISSPENNRRYLRFRKFAGGTTRTVAEIEKPVSWGLTVSPDGRSVLYSQVDEAGSDLMLINNFR